MYCINCGKEAAEGAVYCTNCGAKLFQKPEQDMSAGQPSAENVKQVITEHNQGSSQTASGASPTAANTYVRKKINPGIIIIAAAAVVVVAFILILGSGGGGYKDYKALAHAYCKAIYREDVDAMIKLFDKYARKELKEDKEDLQEAIEKTKDYLNYAYGRDWYENIDIGRKETVDRDEGLYRVEIEIDGNFYQYLGIKKNDDDRYYIDEDYFVYY